MLRSPRSLGLTALLLLAPMAGRAADPTPAPASEPPAAKNCLGEPTAKRLLSSTTVGMINPLGLEEQLQYGGCHPLIRTPGELFDYSNFQYGVVAYLAPVYAMPGAFVSVAPLSILELRAEAEWIGMWPIGLDGAGYFPLSGYDADWQHLPAATGQAVTGFTAALTLNLQVELPVAQGWTVAAFDSAAWSFWQLGDAGYYYNTKFDLPLARRDRVLRNISALMIGRELGHDIKLRVGLSGDLQWVQGSHYWQNVLAGIVTADIPHWPSGNTLVQPFVRVGGYTRHDFREGQLQLLGGIGFTFDVTPARK